MLSNFRYNFIYNLISQVNNFVSVVYVFVSMYKSVQLYVASSINRLRFPCISCRQTPASNFQPNLGRIGKKKQKTTLFCYHLFSSSRLANIQLVGAVDQQRSRALVLVRQNRRSCFGGSTTDGVATSLDEASRRPRPQHSPQPIGRRVLSQSFDWRRAPLVVGVLEAAIIIRGYAHSVGR